MPRRYDADPRTDARIAESDAQGVDDQLSSVIGSFTINGLVQRGGERPEWVRQGWTGLTLPYRWACLPSLVVDETSGNRKLLVNPASIRQKIGEVSIFTIDAFNALVDGGRSEEILEYWMNILNRPGASPTDKALFDVGEHDGLVIDEAVENSRQRLRYGDFTPEEWELVKPRDFDGYPFYVDEND